MGIIWFLIGLVVGWNFLPQPGFVRNAVEAVIAKIKGN